jgi:hypothetical protein
MKKKIKEKLEKLFEENTAGYDYVLAVEINKLLKEERNQGYQEGFEKGKQVRNEK